MAIAELDFSLITKRKRMLDSVGHYARPDLFRLEVDSTKRSLVGSTTGTAPQTRSFMPLKVDQVDH